MGFKFGNYELRRSGFINLNDERRQQNEDIIKRIHRITPIRIAKQIKDWQTATLVAESVVNPLNYLLIAIYRDIETDAHLYALMQTLVLKVLSNNYVWVTTDAQGNDTVDQVATEKFRKKWFRKFLINTVNSKFYGYSLNQMGNFVNGYFDDCVLVPRDYVNQRLGIVQLSLSSTQNGVPFVGGEFDNWVLGVGDVDDLGLLHKAAPLVINKKEILGSWAEAAQIFGMPMRTGKTNISSPKNRQNMEEMLENMGSAAWGVFDKDDVIDFVQGKKTDFYMIYDKFIDRVNSELSKLFVLQTGTTDEKAFVGSAEVHNDILTDVINSLINFVEEVVNERLKPFCLKRGMITDAHTFKCMNDQPLSNEDLLAALVIFLQYYDLPATWVNEKFDIPVEEKPVTPPPVPGERVKLSAAPSEVMNQLKAIYSKKHTHARRHAKA